MQFELTKAEKLRLPIDPNSVDLEWFVTMLEEFDPHKRTCVHCPNNYLSGQKHTGRCGADAVRDMSKWLTDHGCEIPIEFEKIKENRSAVDTLQDMREPLRRLLDETNTPPKDPTSLFALLD